MTKGSESALRKYVKSGRSLVTAVQIDLDTDGFTYRKWGGLQSCSAGDWLVNNAGDVYTVDRATFERTYEATGPGVFRKTAPVWALVAEAAGEVEKKEGTTRFAAGDYIVSNDPTGEDVWAVEAEKFERMYQPAE